ncbi:uncharacterized protein LOC119987884 [Tripterygium wilfordii]|uniref:uncharacterized protein LOC119987884 n=1 Tax=Tripterygium wilfordii TaxID=458696 RepID=UPI0018F841C5|nr:uncharacterized protein LOC119987884 [Tripterygium wilfordii]
MQTAGDMIFSLQEMFQQTTRPARQQAIKKLMNAKQAEGTPVREHMLKVMEYLYEALDLGAEIDGQTQVDMVLETLSSSFSQFKLNFNMNKMEMSLPMLMKELQSTEQIMGKEKQVHFVKIRQLNLDQDLCYATGLDFLKGLVVAISTILRVKKYSLA